MPKLQFSISRNNGTGASVSIQAVHGCPFTFFKRRKDTKVHPSFSQNKYAVFPGCLRHSHRTAKCLPKGCLRNVSDRYFVNIYTYNKRQMEYKDNSYNLDTKGRNQNLCGWKPTRHSLSSSYGGSHKTGCRIHWRRFFTFTFTF